MSVCGLHKQLMWYTINLEVDPAEMVKKIVAHSVKKEKERRTVALWFWGSSELILIFLDNHGTMDWIIFEAKVMIFLPSSPLASGATVSIVVPRCVKMGLSVSTGPLLRNGRRGIALQRSCSCLTNFHVNAAYIHNK